jgi:hypothetical protein
MPGLGRRCPAPAHEKSAADLEKIFTLFRAEQRQRGHSAIVGSSADGNSQAQPNRRLDANR